ncbi:Uncharacterized protein TPAR_03229 [Tolypocladium paradoxum]|uniref:Uncharacterized protein n=1 Tax=Tolypocladium paradoxum TaxID=94208 RepID=A0A2S4L257_9HYPO|nr:Uncharacterized protein TPAR_03229 [Tolypocladium paradoxum]
MPGYKSESLASRVIVVGLQMYRDTLRVIRNRELYRGTRIAHSIRLIAAQVAMRISWPLSGGERPPSRPPTSQPSKAPEGRCSTGMSGSSLYFGSPEPGAQVESRASMHGTAPQMMPSHEHDADPDDAVSSSPDAETARRQAPTLANKAPRCGNKSPYPFGLPGRESLTSSWSYSDTLSGERTPSSSNSHEEYDDDHGQESMPHRGNVTSAPPTTSSNSSSSSSSNSPRSQTCSIASPSSRLSDWLMPRPVSSPPTSSPRSLTDSILSLFEPLPSAEAQRDRPPYTAWSPKGQRRLRYIRHALSMPHDACPEAVQDFLARNPSVIRHLAYNTVGHPDWAFDDRGVDGAEVHVCGAAVDRNLLLYQAIAEVFWQSRRVWDVLDMAAEPTDETEWTLRVWFRKRRRDAVPLASFTRMLDEDPDLVMEDHQRRALAQEIRRKRPDSLLKCSTGVADIEDRDARDSRLPSCQDSPDVNHESY